MVDLFIDDLGPKFKLKLGDISTRKHLLRFLLYSKDHEGQVACGRSKRSIQTLCF